jgi:tRNA dimethylallyltransferase
MTGVGYREIARVLAGATTLEEATEAIRRRTRQYARRQLTWFRNQLPGDARPVDATAPLDVQIARVLDAWTEAGGTLPGSPDA